MGVGSRPLTGAAKRAVDLVVGGALLVLASPVIVVIAVAVRLTMGRPVLHRDLRAGRGGRPFALVKFRTMRPLRPGETIPESDGARITPVGRVLRATSLDELVGLVHVVTGEMSLVGPRPLPVRYLDRYSPTQRRRLEVRPGITGLAQVRGRNQLGWDEKLALDVWYVDHRSLALDARILVETVTVVLRRSGIDHGDQVTMPEFLGEGSAPAAPGADDAG